MPRDVHLAAFLGFLERVEGQTRARIVQHAEAYAEDERPSVLGLIGNESTPGSATVHTVPHPQCSPAIIAAIVDGATPKKVIVVPGRLVNVVV